MSCAVDPSLFKSPLATLRERLDLECTETDAQGRYVLDWDAMNEVVDAIDEIEEALSSDGRQRSAPA